jgi:sulfur carrier protein ThiS
LKIRVHYDFTQRVLVGDTEVLEIAEGSKLGDLLRNIDTRIIDIGKSKAIETTYKTIIVGNQLNGCVVFVNGAAPGKMLEEILHDGDMVEFVYGFCGG